MKKLKIHRTLEHQNWVALDIGLKDCVFGCGLKGLAYAFLRGNSYQSVQSITINILESCSLGRCFGIYTILHSNYGEGNGTPLQYSCLEYPMDRGAWWAAVHGVTKSWTRLSDFPFTFHFHALEKEMATHSRVLAWRIPGTEEPGGLLSMGSHRVGHDWSNLAAAAAAAL